MERFKDYESPEMEIILVDDSDVIITSGLGGGGDVESPFGF